MPRADGRSLDNLGDRLPSDELAVGLGEHRVNDRATVGVDWPILCSLGLLLSESGSKMSDRGRCKVMHTLGSRRLGRAEHHPN